MSALPGQPPPGSDREDPFELLLPEDANGRREHAERVVRCVRLLLADTAHRWRPSVETGLAAARTELARQLRERQVRALASLAAAYLRPRLEGLSFLAPGPAPLGIAEAWAALAALGSAREEGTEAPAPDEPAPSVARRMVDALERLLGADDPRIGLWRGRLARVERGPQAGEAVLRDEFERAQDLDPALQEELAAGVAACLLDRAAVRRAEVWLEEALGGRRCGARVERLRGWCRLLLGDPEGARRHLAPLAPWSGVLPRPLAALRAERAEWGDLLSGGEPAEQAPHEPLPPLDDPAAARRALGGVALLAFDFDPAQGPQLVAGDVAPGLRARLDAWLEERRDAHTLPTEPEHRLVLEARPLVARGEPSDPPRGALGGPGTLALAFAPRLDPTDGEVVGWWYLEWEHHLVPPPERLAALGATGPVAARPAGGEDRPLVVRERPAPRIERCAAVFEGLIAHAQLGLSRRRWYGFDVRGGEPSRIAEGGGALAGGRPGGGRALRRALATGGVVRLEGPDPRLSICAEAASALVVPLVYEGWVHGLLVVESTRRGDFRARDAERLGALAAELAPAYRLAQFRAALVEIAERDVCFDTSLDGVRSLARRVRALGRARTPVTLVGSAGSGRRTLARWLAFEGSPAGERPALVLLGPEGERAFEALTANDGPRCVLEPERLPPQAQLALARRLERAAAGEGPRLFVITSCPPEEARAGGRLAPELAVRLERAVLRVPALEDRREELPALARFLLERAAEEEGHAAPRLAPEALALLWRRSWPGGVAELEGWAHELVLTCENGLVDADLVRAVSRARRAPLPPKLRARHPRRRDLVAALRVTAFRDGRANKRAAAWLLGWDPDTLVARIGEARLDLGRLAEEPWGWA